LKKLTVFLCSLALVFSLAGFAGAASYNFEDMIDYWGPLNVDAAFIGQNSPLSYSHDINDSVDFGAGDLVTSATLELDFTNDLTDDNGSYVQPTFWGPIIFRWDYREYSRAAYDGQNWFIGEVGNGQYDLVLDVDWLNDDGFLDVTVRVWNPLGTATAWLDHSRLYGTAATNANGNGTAPVPEPSTILLMGVGLLGLVAVGRRKFNP
jgi:hypothetical protein